MERKKIPAKRSKKYNRLKVYLEENNPVSLKVQILLSVKTNIQKRTNDFLKSI